MRRRVVTLDQLATALVALVLVALGLLLAAWWSARFPAVPEQLDLAPVTTAAEASWWPWAAGALGLVLVLVGLRWLAAHLPQRGVGALTLPGSGREGRLLVDAGSVADAAADALEETRGVRSARGTVRKDRGQVVALLAVTVEQDADLERVASAVDVVSGDLARTIGRDDVRCRVDLHVARRRRGLSRVR